MAPEAVVCRTLCNLTCTLRMAPDGAREGLAASGAGGKRADERVPGSAGVHGGHPATADIDRRSRHDRGGVVSGLFPGDRVVAFRLWSLTASWAVRSHDVESNPASGGPRA